MAVLFTSPFVQYCDSTGAPLAGGKIYTYSAGTTTPRPTYTTAAGDTENANPVILDAAGRAVIFISGAYKYVIKDADDNTIETVDNVTAFTVTADSSTAFFESFSGDGTTTEFTLSSAQGTDENALWVFIDAGLDEYVVNGDFATDTTWTKGTGWSIGSGVATAAGAISTAIEQTADVTLVDGQVYALTYTITRSAGGLIPSIGGTDGTERTASGTYTEVIVAGSTQDIKFTGNAFTGTLDNVSITRVMSDGRQVQNPASFTVSGTTLTFATAPRTGTNNILVWNPASLVGAASTAAAAAEAAETGALAAQAAAETAQTNAETAETNAAASAAKLSGTSTTSLLIEVASKVFTTQADKFFDAGSFLLITSDADPTNYMFGQVTSYSSTTLTVNVTVVGGSGTFADWTIRVCGTRGATGATGSALPDGDYGDITVGGSGTTMTIDDDVITLAKMAGGTDGNLITYDANGDPAYVATGTSGQVLTSNGAGAAPTFEDASAGGAWTLVSITSGSGASSIDVDLTAATGKNYKIISFISNGTTANAQNILYSTDGGSTFVTTSGYFTAGFSGTTAAPTNFGATVNALTPNNTFGTDAIFTELFLFDCDDAATHSTYRYTRIEQDTSDRYEFAIGRMQAVNDITDIRFIAAAGTVTGTAYLYVEDTSL